MFSNFYEIIKLKVKKLSKNSNESFYLTFEAPAKIELTAIALYYNQMK